MIKQMKNKKWLVRTFVQVGLCAALLLLLFIRLKAYKSANAAETDALKQTRQELTVLDTQKRDLIRQVETLQKQNIEENRLSYRITPIITNMQQTVFEETIGLFENYKWTGLFGLSANTIPGSKGMISRQMYEQYIDKGWETCLYWDGNSDLSVFLEDMTNRLEKQGFEFPSTLVLDSADYPQDYDELAKKYEFKTIVYTPADDETMKLAPDQTKNGITRIVLCDWYDYQFEDYVLLAEQQGGVFCVTCSNNVENSDVNTEDTRTFLRFLYNQSMEDSKCSIGKLEYSFYQDEKNKANDELQAYNNQIEQLTNEIIKVNQKRMETLGLYE